jgi:hypothetical protein
VDNSGDNYPKGTVEPPEIRQLAKCLIYVQCQRMARDTPISCGLTGFSIFQALMTVGNELGELPAYVVRLSYAYTKTS